MSAPYVPFYPSDWLAGTRGLSAVETGVYITIIAMMYEREAPIDIDRKRLARLCGATPATFEKALDALISEGKIIIENGGLWNARVQIEIEKRSEKSEGARASAKKRWGKTKQNQHKGDANAVETQCEPHANQNQNQNQSRDGGGGSACAREAAPPDETPRERLLVAMGHDRSGITASGRVVGNPADMAEAQRWSALGLSEAQQVAVITEVMARKRDGPPVAFSYFSQAMQRRAGELSKPDLKPTAAAATGATRHGRPSRGEDFLDAFLAGARSAS